MRWLNHDEGGAIAVLVALLLVVMMGLSSVVIDVGGLFYERRQLQNAADAAALAIAYDCAGGDCGTANDTAAELALANTSGSNVENVTSVTPATGEVTVSVRTGETDGSPGVVQNVFHAASTALLDTTSGSEESIVRAEATAIWGAVGGATTLPIAICERAWDHYTDSGATLPSGPPEHLLRFSVPPGQADELDDCTGPSGDTYAGGFGFLERDSTCQATTTRDDLADGVNGDHPGNNSGCPHSTLYALWRSIIDDGGTVLIPIFDDHIGTGTHGQFHVVGYAPFVFRGFSINGGPGTPAVRRYQMSGSECPGGASCLKGYFGAPMVDSTALPEMGGPDFGATAVALSR